MTLQRQLYLAAYDIGSDRKRAAALDLLRGYATGGQKSVHEVWLTPAEKCAVLADMPHLLDTDDRFALMRLDPRARTLGGCRTWESPAANRPQRSISHRLLGP